MYSTIALLIFALVKRRITESIAFAGLKSFVIYQFINGV